MNEFTAKATVKNQVRRTQPQKKPWAFHLMINCGIMLAMIFTAFAIRVSLNDRIEKLSRKAASIIRETEETDLQIRNLVAQREKYYNLKYVERKIKEYHLALRPTTNTQRRYLKRFDTTTVRSDGSYQLAALQEDEGRNYQASINR